ncbi:hypothetical protein [Glutamicibacter ardleyensis]|uniref:hypothetical protein n=1 Tax=Glutamicibacter ardleyensis TaxID=225894 RepID=UPI003FD44DAC
MGLWIMVAVVTARTAGRRPWDAAMVALALGIILAATTNMGNVGGGVPNQQAASCHPNLGGDTPRIMG